MHKVVGWLWLVGIFCFSVVALAQTPVPSTAATAFDGTYGLVTSAKVNETYTERSGRLGQCPNRRPGPLHIINDQARYTTATGDKLRGSVGPQGQLAMRIITPPNTVGAYRPVEINLSGGIDGSGTVRARQIGNSCSYDFVWQKQTR
jgi:hypothetical protein